MPDWPFGVRPCDGRTPDSAIVPRKWPLPQESQFGIAPASRSRTMTTLFRSIALAVSVLATLGVAGAAAAPADDRVLPVDSYTSEKARTLARTHATALRDLNA